MKKKRKGSKVHKELRYQIWVTPEGEEYPMATKMIFKDKAKAYNFAYVETLAGMGEDYDVRPKMVKIKPKQFKKLKKVI